MITAADRPVVRSAPAKLLIADADGHVRHAPRHLIDVLRPGDLVIANDAATLPASLNGRHLPSQRAIEVRLAGRGSLARDDVREFAAIVFGEGDFHIRTEHRPAPPPLVAGDRLEFGPLAARGGSLASHRDGRGASLTRRDDREYREYLSEEQRSQPRGPQRGTRVGVGPGCIARRMQPDFHYGLLGAAVLKILGHPRLVRLAFDGTPDEIWAGLARHGRPIQYAHVPEPLALWDVWTAIAGPPVAFEPPSAGFVLDWQTLSAMRARKIEFATLTHAAGISSTGDEGLDALLPFEEPYDIPGTTVSAIESARLDGRRIVAVGTTVVRALEHAAGTDGRVHRGPGLANQRIGQSTRLRVVNAIVSGVHDPGTSHCQLLQAFTNDATLARMQEEMAAHDYRSHEFGDSVFVESMRPLVA